MKPCNWLRDLRARIGLPPKRLRDSGNSTGSSGRPPWFRPRCESLEDREVPAVLNVPGTAGNDNIVLDFRGDNTVEVIGVPSAGVYSLDVVTAINLDGNGGFDQLFARSVDSRVHNVTLFNWEDEPSRSSIVGLAATPGIAVNYFNTLNTAGERMSQVFLDTNITPGNTVNIWDTGVPTVLWSYGQTTVNIGDGWEGVQGIRGAITINNSESRGTTLNVRNVGNSEVLGFSMNSDAQGGLITGLAPAPIRYSVAAVSELTVEMSAAAVNSAFINAVPVPTKLIGHGSAYVNIWCAPGSFRLPLELSNTSYHATTLNIHQVGSHATPIYLADSSEPGRGFVHGLTETRISYDYFGTGEVNLWANSSPDNSFVVWDTGTATNIFAFAPSRVIVGNTDVGVQGIRGSLRVSNFSHAGTVLEVVDSNNGIARHATLSDSFGDAGWGTIFGLAPATISYNYDGTDNVQVRTGRASGNSVSVLQTGVPVTLFGSNRTTVSVGNGDYGVQDILAPLEIRNSRLAGTFLSVNDAANPSSQNAVVSISETDKNLGTIVGLAPAAITYTNSGTGRVTVVASDAGWNVITAKRTAVPTALYGGAGSDRFVLPTPGALYGLTIGGGGGSDWLDYSESPRRVAVNLAYGYASGVAGGVFGIENVRGSAFNDTVIGNAAGNLLLGGGGSDKLNGGAGADVLVGGLGADSLNGGLDEDLLIGGTTTFDDDAWVLQSIADEWQSFWDYADRTDNLTLGGGFNGDNLLLWTTTVLDDSAVDTLTGDPAGPNTALDWYFKGGNDEITAKQNGEKINS